MEKIKEELARIELEESQGYIYFPGGFKIIAMASPAEVIYHFKYKEELKNMKGDENND